MGFFTRDNEVRPITKPLSNFSRKRFVVNPSVFNGVKPKIVSRLLNWDIHDLHLRKFRKPLIQSIYDPIRHQWWNILWVGRVSLWFGPDHIVYDVKVVPHEFWSGSWSRTKPEVYIDNDMPERYWDRLSGHEGVEKHSCEKYGLDDIEGHYITEPAEQRWSVKKYGVKDWNDYSAWTDYVMRKEWQHLQQGITPEAHHLVFD